MDAKTTGRLQRVQGTQTVKLTHYGRKSGKPYQVTIWFAVDDGRVYLPTSNVERQWARNLKTTPRLELAIGDEHFAGEARFLTRPAERDGAMTAVRRKYWVFLPVIVIGQLLASLGIVTDRSGVFEVKLSG